MDPVRNQLKQIINELRSENKVLRLELQLHQQEIAFLRELVQELKPPSHVLKFIKIAIGGIMPVGPAKLTVGDKKTATVLGFDQNGSPFPIDFTANPVTWADDNAAVCSDAPASDGSDPLTAVSAGVMNLTATCAGLTDTEAVTVVAAAPKLSSIKISID